ncbi:MAG: alpha/beta hydrolase [Cyclobacteriaceae bacterium]|nr:alpha/beta hydrolase [Cyclobacteriaceae bacterium]
MFQDSLIFQKKSLASDYAFKFAEPFEEHFIKTEDGQSLNVIIFKSKNTSRGLILYFHGNADNLQRWGNYAVDLTSLDYDVLMMDYRGYGKSTGTPDEINLYKDAQTILDWSRQNLVYSRLIIYGRSLGSAVASHLATTANPELLILETPFDELKGAVHPPLKTVLGLFPLNYKFSNKEFLSLIKCKKVIIHGTNDWVVPLSSALELKPLLNEQDQFVIIKDGGHKNLRDFKEYHEVIRENLK